MATESPTPAHRGLLVSAPTSGAGKTVIALALMRAFHDRGMTVQPAKSGPDYIDPTFHAVATRRESINLDAWAMTPERLTTLSDRPGLLIVEGAMGLFDGAADGAGSAADLAETLDLPVLLVLDAARASHSLGAVLRGFATHRRGVRIAGVIANRLASPRHAAMVQAALRPVCDELDIHWLGHVQRDAGLELPSRHLGLVPASEHDERDDFVANAARLVRDAIDLDGVLGIAERRSGGQSEGFGLGMPPLGQRIAVARDAAFAFVYEHHLADWRTQGVEIASFSPLADEAPPRDADAVFLPGGYPELHAARIATSEAFRSGVRQAVERGAVVYGECGGYMVLGRGLTDANGLDHPMLDLLPLETSFAQRRLQLGYRRVRLDDERIGGAYRAHEHHHATTVWEGAAARPFRAWDANGKDCGSLGLRVRSTYGSFLHLIDGERA